jgi:hypothetical protein
MAYVFAKLAGYVANMSYCLQRRTGVWLLPATRLNLDPALYTLPILYPVSGCTWAAWWPRLTY